MAGKFNLGRDLSIQVSIAGNVVQQFGFHTDTHFRPQWTEAKVRPTNNGGVFVVRPIFGGYEVEVQFARINGVADDLMQYLEDNFKSGGPDPDVTMQETIRNDDGTTNQYIYINGAITPQDAGSFKGVDEVSQTIKFFFPERQAVSSGATQLTLGGQGLPAIA
jgi:hypothetical protein